MSHPSPTIAAPSLTLGRIVVLVREYDAALAFYQAAFGARVLFDAPSPAGDRYLHLGFGDGDVAPEDGDTAGVGIWLLRASGEDSASIGRQTGGHPVAVFYTADVRAAIARCVSGGAVVRPLATANGASFAHVADLYGNEFVLVEMTAGAI